MTAYADTISRPVKTLTEAEQRALLKVTGQHVDGFRDHVIFSLAMGTGLREHELLALDVGDVFDDTGRAKRRVALRVFKRSAKEPVAQEVLLPDAVRAKLERLLTTRKRAGETITPTTPVFVSRLGRRLSARQLRHLFAVWQERAGFERHLGFHTLRHHACSAVYRQSKDLRLTQKFARHKSVVTTSIYTHPTDDELLRAVQILDEAHHVAASTFRSVVDRCPARFRLGLTATPEREDGLTALLDLFLGPPLVTVTHEELVAAGVLTVPEIRSIETDFQYVYTGADDYAPMLAAVASDRARNALIIEHVVEEARAGHVCLVLSGRIDHCHALCDGVAANGISAAVLTGEVKRAVRKELLERARAGELSVIVATSLADEGLDLPRLSRVFLAYPGRARGRTVQRLGRLMRPHAEKTDAALFDFVDRKVPLLRRHHLERRKLYAEVLGIPASKLGARKGAA